MNWQRFINRGTGIYAMKDDGIKKVFVNVVFTS